MGWAKTMEDNFDSYFENNYGKDHYSSGVFMDGTVVGCGMGYRKPERIPQTDYKPSFKLREERMKKETVRSYDCVTKAFTINRNTVTITTPKGNVFWALKCSLKEAGGKYNPKSRTWSLTDNQLAGWVQLEKNYGWL